MKRITVILLLLPMLLSAQGPADWWYFGQNAGLHFTSSGPTSVSGGQLNTSEGCTSISSDQGELLFYTDGSDVYNANHLLMLNGTGLMGNSSAAQSAIVAPFPENPSKYFIITIPFIGDTLPGMRYSVVDMTLAGGLGGIVANQKNILIKHDIVENATIVPHASTNKYWLVSHKAQSDSVYAFLIDNSGINLNPVVSQVGPVITAKLGCIKASISGSYIFYTNNSALQGAKLMKFNKTTGEITDHVYFEPPNSVSRYGTEFSPDASRLYISAFGIGSVYQYSISVFDSTTIINSETELFNGHVGQLQLGPDHKIYLARYQQPFLARINSPNGLGLSCDFQDTAVTLVSGVSNLGLPPFLTSIFEPTLNSEDVCFGDSSFFYTDTSLVDSVHWEFGDPGSGAANTSSLFTPTHLFSDTGTFTVMLIARSAIDSTIDTVLKEVIIYPRQTLDLGPDTTLCTLTNYVLDASEPFSSYLWNDGSTADTFVVSQDSVVWVTLFGICDTLRDTVQVSFDDSIKFDLGPDTTFCEGQPFVLDTDLKVNADIYWNTGDSTDSIIVTQSGLYQMNAINACGPAIDTVRVEVIPIPPADSNLLPSDTVNCFANTITLERPDNDSITFMWNDSSSVRRKEIDTTQTVWLAAYNQCGFSIDTMHLIFNPEIITELGEDTTICDEDSIQLFGTDSLATYVWNTGDTTDTIWTTPGVDENYIVTIKLGLCERVESRRVFADDLACPSIDCDIEYANIFTPNGDGVNDRFQLWSSCDIHRFDMAVYNRWGQLVNYSTDIAYGWDGFINGEPASVGTYYFVVEYKDQVVVDADRQLVRGSFTLQR